MNEHLMATHNELGKRGEALAMNYLRKQHFEICETNWRHGRSEIDIIARKDGILIFIEVKTRSDRVFGEPASFLGVDQEMRIANAAAAYMEFINHDWAVRFDVISILIPSNGEAEIEHFQDAFFPGTH